ncbi:MAG: hypothetical protein CL570_05895 [Alphaproteobacteria bacterium]|nr:hypothetical protein [Alphaproteobacteria bacterium]|tara:strand:+ start:11913 stop:12440 length:528 start_codon:yes stop_codon:yes gene_type:complete
MKTLYLMRHAHCPVAYDLRDSQRPLSVKGHAQAKFIGAFMAQNGHAPSEVLCSTAVRVQETLASLRQTADLHLQQGSIHAKDILYNGSTGDYLHALQSLPDTCNSAMLIGHNPVIPALVTFLCDEDKSVPALYQSLISYYTPATLTQLTCPIDHWKDLAPYKNALTTVTQPKPAA